MKPLYFDYNATTPVHPRVFEAMRPYLTAAFGNPGSGHAWGLAAKRAVERARGRLAALLGAREEEIVFTGSATESNNTVLMGLFPDFRGRLATTAVEHPAVLEPARYLASRGVDLDIAPVDANGLPDPDDMAELIDDRTRLVSVMLAQNETGAILPVAEIASLARGRGVPVHADAAQAVGKIPVDVEALGVDYLTAAGHKFGAPKGVGALFVRSGRDLPPLLRGGGQEAGRRSSTENVALIVGLGEAAAIAAEDLPAEAARQREIGDIILAGLSALPLDMAVHAAGAPRLPNTLCVGLAGLTATDVLSSCVGFEVGISAGAACHGSGHSLSHVLVAMGAPERYALGTLRISWGRGVTHDDARELVSRLGRVVAQLTGKS